MTLEEKVAKRYRDFIRIEDILRSIADKYQCSLEEASLVLEEALSHMAWRGLPGLYEPGELRPNWVNSVHWCELRKMLKKKRLDAPARSAYQKYLCHRDEISGILRKAGFPIDEAPPLGDDHEMEGARTANDGGYTSEHEIRLADMERELAVAKVEIKRITELVPPFPEGLMKIAIEVQRNHWSIYDPKTGSNRPNQDSIVREIKEAYGLSNRQAVAVALVASRSTTGEKSPS